MQTYFQDLVGSPKFQAWVERNETEPKTGMEKNSAPIDKETLMAPQTAEPITEVIHLPRPSNDEHGLAAIPIVRHWLFAPDGSDLNWREVRMQTQHRRRTLVQTVRIGDRYASPGRGYGILTTRHQRALFALQQLWQKQGGKLVRIDGKRHGIIRASSWELEHSFFGSHGGREKRMARAVVQQLDSIPVEILNYIHDDGTVGDISISGLVGGVEYHSVTHNGGRRGPWVSIYLSSLITRAFENHAVKPMNLSVLRTLRRDLSALLYPKIDYHLSTHTEVALRLDGLVEKLGLQNKQMHKRSYRQAKFVPVAEDLNGQPLSKDGYIIEARLVQTSDRRDHKLAARRRRHRRSPLSVTI